MLLATHLAAAGALLSQCALAAPANKRQLLGLDLSNVISGVTQANDFNDVRSAIQNIDPLSPPPDTERAVSRLQAAYAKTMPRGIFQAAAQIIAAGIHRGDLASAIAAYTTQNSPSNVNRQPRTAIYPKKNFFDAPYARSQKELLERVFIPPTFTYGKKPPVILVPGTGARGGNTFSGNFIKTLAGQSWADPVWINPPGFMLADIQLNAEDVAYAINYISSVSGGQKVRVIGWSQASIAIQWALKYWPSTRALVEDVVAISGDYKGTILANLIDPQLNVPFPPSIAQQTAGSNFINTLRSDDGGSSYVPTTTVHSRNFDEIVEPQFDPFASSNIDNARGAGASNFEQQAICPRGSPGASFYTHEGMLASSLAFALVKDAFTHAGPADISRINVNSVCSKYLAPGLDLEDFLTTESTIPGAGAAVLAFKHKIFGEPPIKPYAR